MKETTFVAYNNFMKKLTAFLILIFLFTLGLAGFKTITAISHPLRYQNEIIKYANEYNLAPELVASVINAESHYKKDAESHKKRTQRLI